MPRDTITIRRTEHKRLLQAEARLKDLQKTEDMHSYKAAFRKKIKQALQEEETGKTRTIRGSKDLL